MSTQTSPAGLNLQRAGFYADFILCPLGIAMLLSYAWMLGPDLETLALCHSTPKNDQPLTRQQQKPRA